MLPILRIDNTNKVVGGYLVVHSSDGVDLTIRVYDKTDITTEKYKMTKQTLQSRIPSIRREVHIHTEKYKMDRYTTIPRAFTLLNRLVDKEELIPDSVGYIIKYYLVQVLIHNTPSIETSYTTNLLYPPPKVSCTMK
jgi:hypothetical protein